MRAGQRARAGGCGSPLAWPLDEGAAKKMIFRLHVPSPGGGWAGSCLTSSAKNRPDAQAENPGQGWGHTLWSCKPSSLARTFHRPSGCIHPSVASPLDSRGCKRALKSILEEQSSFGAFPVIKKRKHLICFSLSKACSASRTPSFTPTRPNRVLPSSV